MHSDLPTPQIAQNSVLLIEDESEMYLLLRGILEPEGFTVDHAGSIAEARQFLQRRQPALVFLDNRLPDGNGFDFLDTLRMQHPGTKIIVISGIDISAREYALESGAHAFLRKPFAKDHLLGIVRGLLREAPMNTNLSSAE
jgi:two-component system OmpR family response regulator